MTDSPEKREPFEEILSRNVRVLYGFKDAHAVIHVKTPVGIPVTVQASKDDIAKVKEHFEKAAVWFEGPVEVEIRSDARVRYGFADKHVELGVWKLVWIWLSFPYEEFLLAKKAFENAHGWAQLPEDVRSLQGVAA